MPDANGLKVAAAEGIATFAHSHRGMTREAHEDLIHAELERIGADYVALCGYMRILTPGLVDRWAGRMLNTHPSLLPPIYPASTPTSAHSMRAIGRAAAPSIS